MSHEDPYRPDRDRGAYTPSDDDLSYRRPFDPRGGGGGWNGPPVTLLVSAAVLVALIIAVAIFYRAGLRSSSDAPPAVGTPVGENIKVEAPVEAQPVDPAEGIEVYDRSADPIVTAPTYAPPPEEAQPRPAPPAATETRPATPAPAPKAEASAPPVGGASSVQIGAFSTPGIADQQYAALTSRYPQLTRGGAKRVQEVTSSGGATLYRTTITGLSRQQATALCDAIKAGGGDCFVR